MPRHTRGTTLSNDTNIIITNLITLKAMINYKAAKKYCSEDISLIENYKQAALDPTEVWDIHHRKETDLKMLRKELIASGQYYNVPASDLILLTKADHSKLHANASFYNNRPGKSTKGKQLSEEHKRNISLATSGENNPQFGAVWSDERRKKMSETRKARIANGQIKIDTSACHTEEARKKVSEKAKERLTNPENHPMFGRLQSDEAKKKISAKMKGRIPWNKGKKLNKRGQ